MKTIWMLAVLPETNTDLSPKGVVLQEMQDFIQQEKKQNKWYLGDASLELVMAPEEVSVSFV